MGRPPCCEKIAVKKGPWTPEEDITLVTYVQEHGPGNWKAVPSITGLNRCSKSCRLRWTNYLRPGIKRGGFTDQEEKMIIHLQALLGNKWAAISSYLPERTDNDIKNYWNTHLKKKLKKSSTDIAIDDQSRLSYKLDGFSTKSRGQCASHLQANISTTKEVRNDALSFDSTPEVSPAADTKPVQSISYASSTGNIARLLKGWVKAAPISEESSSKCCSSNQNSSNVKSSCSDQDIAPTPSTGSKSGVDLFEPCREILFGFDAFKSSTCDEFLRTPDSLGKVKAEQIDIALPPLAMIEWLLDDHQGKDYFIDPDTFDHENGNSESSI